MNYLSLCFRITSPLWGLKLTIADITSIGVECSTFRITSSLRGHQNYDILYPEYIYLCVNSTPCYLRPPLCGLKLVAKVAPNSFRFFRITSPLWGHANYTILSPRHRYLCVNSAPHYLRPPLRGLKLLKHIFSLVY